MLPAVLRLAAVLVASLAAFAAQAQMKVGLIASSTGPTAVVGIPQKNTGALLPKKIGDVSVEYIVYDDATEPTCPGATRAVEEMISKHAISLEQIYPHMVLRARLASAAENA